MLRLRRFIVAVLVVIAVPLQGVAATTMQFCAPDRVTIVHVAATTNAVSFATGDPHRGHAMHDASAAMSAAGEASAAGHPAHAGHAPEAKSKRSVCASCCAAAAMPASAIVFVAGAAGHVFAAPASIGAPAFLTAGLERPPRSFLA